MPHIRVTRVNIPDGQSIDANTRPPGAYLAQDGRLFLIYQNPHHPSPMIMYLDATASRSLVSAGDEPAQAVDVHRLLDQIIDIQGARIDATHGVGVHNRPIGHGG